MGKIGVFVERYSISNSYEMNAIMRFSQVARKMGHQTDFLFRPDIYKIPEYDAIFIRALTDPLNAAYVAARTAELHDIRVIDDPNSIVVCCDKVNMYRHLMRASIPIPKTTFIEEQDLSRHRGQVLLEEFGNPLVLKAPNTSFSMYVERVSTPDEFVSVGRRFFRRADRIVIQRFLKSDFDWRIGVLGGKPLYACRYVIPRKRWKILSYTAEGRAVHGPVQGVPIHDVKPALLQRAVEASQAIGNGLYGVDLKEIGDEVFVIEVNDNPTILAGDEDQKAGDLYAKLVSFLLPSEDEAA